MDNDEEITPIRNKLKIQNELIEAVKKDDAKGIYDAVKNGADVNDKELGVTPLMYHAVNASAYKAMVALAENGYDLSQEDSMGGTALSYALHLLASNNRIINGKIRPQPDTKEDFRGSLEILLMMKADPYYEPKNTYVGAKHANGNAIALAHELGLAEAAYRMKDIAEGRQKSLSPQEASELYGVYYSPDKRAESLQGMAELSASNEKGPTVNASDVSVDGKVKPLSEKELSEEAIRRTGGRC